MLLTAACIGAWQNGNPLTNFEALDATHFDAVAATGALTRVDDGYPFVFHGGASLLSSASGFYLTMIVPFIHGCGAHWKCTAPF